MADSCSRSTPRPPRSRASRSTPTGCWLCACMLFRVGQGAVDARLSPDGSTMLGHRGERTPRQHLHRRRWHADRAGQLSSGPARQRRSHWTRCALIHHQVGRPLGGRCPTTRFVGAAAAAIKPSGTRGGGRHFRGTPPHSNSAPPLVERVRAHPRTGDRNGPDAVIPGARRDRRELQWLSDSCAPGAEGKARHSPSRATAHRFEVAPPRIRAAVVPPLTAAVPTPPFRVSSSCGSCSTESPTRAREASTFGSIHAENGLAADAALQEGIKRPGGFVPRRFQFDLTVESSTVLSALSG